MYRCACQYSLSLGSARRVLIATGGTGGHLFPAVALAQELSHNFPGIQVCFAGGGLHDNPFTDSLKGNWAICPVVAPKLALTKPLHFAKRMWTGIQESLDLLREFRPHVVVGFGSYHTAPLLYAARRLGIPYVLHEGNAVPGRVNRFFSQDAICTAVHFPSAGKKLAGRVTQVAMPLRHQFHQPLAKEQARIDMGLEPDKPTLLVIGGSQGASALNNLMLGAAPKLAGLSDIQIIHLTGPKHQELAEQLSKTYQQHQMRCVVKAFEERMELAWRAADCCLARAGASSLAEQMACNVPGILVPFPSASDNHQMHNAMSFAAQAGGAIVVSQQNLTADRLVHCLSDLLSEDCRFLRQMRQTMQLRHAAIALQRLSQVVSEMAGWSYHI